jgi:hypothetical protein
MNAQALKFFHDTAGVLRLTVDNDLTHLVAKLVWAAPLSFPGRKLSVLDGKGEEILMVDDPAALDADSRKAIDLEMHRRYITCQVSAITGARSQDGVTYWTVQTDRGQREFVTKSLHENAIWPTDNHVLLVDVDGNRFEIRNVAGLDARSQALVASIL